MRFQILNHRFSRQRLYDWLLHKLLQQMGYGIGGDFLTSGELPTLAYAYRAFRAKPSETPFVVFDIGANTGEYAWHAARICAEQAIIYAFDPDPASYAELERQTASSPMIKAFQLGFGAGVTSQPFFSQRVGVSTSGSFFRYNLEKYDIHDIVETSVLLETLDHFCAEQAIGRLHFLKMDAEGAEYSILQGARQLLQNWAIDWIQFEFSDINCHVGVHFKSFWDMLHPRYRLYRIVRNGLYPIRCYLPRYEIYQTANFLAERCA